MQRFPEMLRPLCLVMALVTSCFRLSPEWWDWIRISTQSPSLGWWLWTLVLDLAPLTQNSSHVCLHKSHDNHFSHYARDDTAILSADIVFLTMGVDGDDDQKQDGDPLRQHLCRCHGAACDEGRGRLSPRNTISLHSVCASSIRRTPSSKETGRTPFTCGDLHGSVVHLGAKSNQLSGLYTGEGIPARIALVKQL